MLKVYFDGVLVDVDSYTELENEYKLFIDNFKLGSVACNTFKLSILKYAVTEQPSEVLIEDDNTTWHFIVDEMVENDDIYVYSLVDKLINFNFDYDAKPLIEEKINSGEECYLSDIWHDMCIKAGVVYDETYNFENDIVVNWYDNRIQARKYLSFIAELQSGYACILENGKQSFKKQKKLPVMTVSGDDCSDIIVGTKKKITRVVYDNGIIKYEFGDETGDTLYLQSENVYIVNESIVENIYNNIKDFEFYIINVPNAPMDSSIRAGDVINFEDGSKTYPTIAQYLMNYYGGWTGNYKLQVNTNRQEETKILGKQDQILAIKTDIDRANATLKITSEKVDENTSDIANLKISNEQILLEVEKIEQLSNLVEGYGSIELTNCGETPLYRLSIKNACQIFPYSGLFPSTTLFFKSRYLRVTYPDSTYDRVKLPPLSLRNIGDVYDELLIENGKVSITKRIGVNSDGSTYLLEEPITTTYDDIVINLKEGTNTLWLESFPNAQLESTYLLKNGYTSNFASKAQVSAEIKVASDEINAEVSQKVGNDEIISRLNLSPEEAKIQSPKLQIEGLTTINGYFKVLEDGSIEAVNGKFTGDIFLNSGGKVIGGDGLLTNLVFSSIDKFGGYSLTGFDVDYFTNPMSPTFKKKDTSVDIIIPDNFTITSAKATIMHTRVHGMNLSGSEIIGYCRNLKLYKATGNIAPLIIFSYGSDYFYNSTGFSGTEIVNAFGTNGYTATNTSSDTVEVVESIDISSQLTTGFNKLYLRTGETTSSIPSGMPSANTDDALSKTGMIILRVDVLGYTSYE